MIDSSLSRLPQVICLGEALVDRLGPPGGDVNSAKDFEDCLGGAPANVACGLAKLGINVSFVGRLGDDQIGQRFSLLMNKRGINLEALQQDSLRPSRIVLVSRDLNCDRTFQGFYGDKINGFADEALDLKLLKINWKSISSQAKWLVIGTIPMANKASSESLSWSINEAARQNINIALDVNWRPTFWDQKRSPNRGPDQMEIDKIFPLFRHVSLLKLADEEAHWFFNTNDPSKISNSLPQGPNVVVTNGKHPIKWFFSGCLGETSIVSDFALVDTTGAGDAFTAGLISQILSDNCIPKSLEQINSLVRFSSACGSLVCQGKGAIEPQPTYHQVKLFLSSS